MFSLNTLKSPVHNNNRSLNYVSDYLSLSLSLLKEPDVLEEQEDSGGNSLT